MRVGPGVSIVTSCELVTSTYHAFGPAAAALLQRVYCLLLRIVPLWPSACHRPSSVVEPPLHQIFGRSAHTRAASRSHSEAL